MACGDNPDGLLSFLYQRMYAILIACSLPEFDSAYEEKGEDIMVVTGNNKQLIQIKHTRNKQMNETLTKGSGLFKVILRALDCDDFDKVSKIAYMVGYTPKDDEEVKDCGEAEIGTKSKKQMKREQKAKKKNPNVHIFRTEFANILNEDGTVKPAKYDMLGKYIICLLYEKVLEEKRKLKNKEKSRDDASHSLGPMKSAKELLSNEHKLDERYNEVLKTDIYKLELEKYHDRLFTEPSLISKLHIEKAPSQPEMLDKIKELIRRKLPNNVSDDLLDKMVHVIIYEIDEKLTSLLVNGNPEGLTQKGLEDIFASTSDILQLEVKYASVMINFYNQYDFQTSILPPVNNEFIFIREMCEELNRIETARRQTEEKTGQVEVNKIKEKTHNYILNRLCKLPANIDEKLTYLYNRKRNKFGLYTIERLNEIFGK